jgi:hypothetical protein
MKRISTKEIVRLSILWGLTIWSAFLGAGFVFMVLLEGGGIIALHLFSFFIGMMFVWMAASMAPSHKKETAYVFGGIGTAICVGVAIWTIATRQWAFTIPAIAPILGIGWTVRGKHLDRIVPIKWTDT